MCTKSQWRYCHFEPITSCSTNSRANNIIATEKEEPVRLDGEVEGSNYGLYRIPKDKFKKGISTVGSIISEHTPDLMALGHYLSNKRNNKRILD